MNAAVQLSHLEHLEAEAITVFREIAAECRRPALLFSGGKDSAVLLRLAEKAFRPGGFPFPLLHVDTGHNFTETIAFRDARVAELGERLIVASVQEAIDEGLVSEPTGRDVSRNRLQSPTLLAALAKHGIDAAFGGGRRDEDRARAKERIASHRDTFGQWNPRHQRPEPWGLLNTRLHEGEHLRVFPMSNWTELDVWHYIEREHLELPSLYFAHRRSVVERGGMLFATGGPVVLTEDEHPSAELVRYRTVGDMTCTAAIRSTAADVPAVITEILCSRVTERGATRSDDSFSDAAMEDRKREGYF